jgi:c-di-GMP-binding flagellar brake protein YcgR
MNREADLKFELNGADDDSHYHVRSRLEIASILRDVMAGKSLVSAYFDAANASLLTAILAVDAAADRLLLDCGPDPRVNERLLRADRLVCVTSLDRVKIQFVTPAPRRGRHAGREAFQLPLPERLLRLQRREFFRLATPVTSPLQCTISAADGDAAASHDLLIADISGGGFAAGAAGELPPLQPQARFHAVITLPEGDVLRADVELRNTFEITLASGRHVRRYGWKFLELPERARIVLERYVMQQQRLRKARARPPA